ncbi:hypothetical protein [Lactococcus formosensis]|uniref:hypothetical protein n=1 Tax=Lactococcus formosensis TaxID=1281486 RepID=UPI001BD05B47|nr:hypothetical protein [Lactococcus formosensis]
MIFIAIIFISLPLLLVLVENFSKKEYETTKDVDRHILHDIEVLFDKAQTAQNMQDMSDLHQLFSPHLYKTYEKKLTKLNIQDKKISIENAELEGITNIKKTAHGFSADLSFKAITYTHFDKNRIEIYWRTIDFLFTPQGNGIDGNNTGYTYFKQRWWFIYNSSNLKVDKIKNFNIKRK